MEIKMLRTSSALAVTLLLGACGISGHYQSEGPCKGFHKDQQACQRAAENASVIGKVKLGQTTEEVSQVMGRGPERREARGETETWWYLTDYMARRSTIIVFKNDRVIEIK
jgi:outer membrane protein assembly factor BamE (lipoprotein component of BamABCDE complex)